MGGGCESAFWCFLEKEWVRPFIHLSGNLSASELVVGPEERKKRRLNSCLFVKSFVVNLMRKAGQISLLWLQDVQYLNGLHHTEMARMKLRLCIEFKDPFKKCSAGPKAGE